MIVIDGGGGGTGDEEVAESLVDGVTIGDDEDEELPVDGGSDTGVIFKTVEVMFEDTKILFENSNIEGTTLFIMIRASHLSLRYELFQFSSFYSSVEIAPSPLGRKPAFNRNE